MKKFTKICLIAGGVCILVGGGITTVAAAMGGSIYNSSFFPYSRYGQRLAGKISREVTDSIMDGMRFNWSGYHDYDWDYDDYDYDYDYDYDDDYWHHNYGNETVGENSKSFSKEYAAKLDLEVRWGKVVVLQDSANDVVSVSCDAPESYWNTYSEGNELKIKVAPAILDTDDYSDMVVYIHVPQGHRFESVDMEVKALGNNVPGRRNEAPHIDAKGLLAGKLEIESAVGGVSVTEADVDKLDIQSDVGAVSFDGTVKGNVDVESKVGAVKLDLTGKKDDYNYEIDCKVGSISVGEDSYSGLSNEKKINNGASKKMELDCSTGSINVRFHESL